MLTGLMLSNVAAQRIVVPLDLGWRTSAAIAPKCDYPLTFKGVQLGNSAWGNSDGHASAAACEATACAANVQAWSYCDKNQCGAKPPNLRNAKNGAQLSGTGPFCVVGSAGRVEPNSKSSGNWTTRGRDTSRGPAADIAEAQLAFDDDSWEVVDLPHDASIKLKYSLNSDGPEGFKPVTQTLYRYASNPN